MDPEHAFTFTWTRIDMTDFVKINEKWEFTPQNYIFFTLFPTLEDAINVVK
jgi:hypothetical protein